MDNSWRDEPASEEQKHYADELGIEYPPNITRGDLRDLIVPQSFPQRRWYEIGFRQLLMWAAVLATLLVVLAIQQWPWYAILSVLCGVGVVAVVERVAGPVRGALWLGLVVGCLYLAGVWLGVQPTPELGGKASGPDPLVSGVLALVNAVVLFVCGFAVSLAVSFVSSIMGLVDNLIDRKARGAGCSHGKGTMGRETGDPTTGRSESR